MFQDCAEGFLKNRFQKSYGFAFNQLQNVLEVIEWNEIEIQFVEVIMIVVVVTFQISSELDATVLKEKFLETAPLYKDAKG